MALLERKSNMGSFRHPRIVVGIKTRGDEYFHKRGQARVQYHVNQDSVQWNSQTSGSQRFFLQIDVSFFERLCAASCSSPMQKQSED